MKAFRSEQELVISFTDYLNRTIRNGHVRILHEFETRNGIADVVLAKLTNGADLDYSIGKYNPRWIAAIAAIRVNQKFSLGEFSDLTGIPIKAAKSALKAFSTAGFVTLIESDLFQKNESLKPIVDEICAVEAKLRNWSRALHQAYRYQDFASQSWVLLDMKHVQPALDNIDKFEKLNVGLASIGTDNLVHLYAIPKPAEPRFQERFWIANCSIATHINQLIVSNEKHLLP